jgi:hypothetical protein
VRKTNIHAKFSLNSTIKLIYKGTSPEFIAGESNNNNKKDAVSCLEKICERRRA